MTSPAEICESSKTTLNHASVLRYPFRGMNVEWLEDYFRSLQRPERVQAVVRILDCLMAHAILHEDPYLEEVVMHLNKTQLPKGWPKYVPQTLMISFEVAHHIFETICVTAKFPTLEVQAKRGLLTMTERLIQDIDKAAQAPSIKMGNNVSAVLHIAQERLRALRKALDSREAFTDFMDALKMLFFNVSVHNGVVPRFDSGINPFDTFVCCEGCPCYGKLCTTYTLFLHDVEKAKITDCIMIAGVKEDDTFMQGVASELLQRHFSDFRQNPHLDDIGRHIHNGRMFSHRTALFSALDQLKYLIRDLNDLTPDALSSVLDYIVLSVLWTKNEVKNIRKLADIVPVLDQTLITAEGVYPRLGDSNCRQDLHTLQDYTTAAFIALSAPEYHLAVHSRDVFVGKPADMRCASPACPDTTKELLKCSGCDVTYYCSPECQKKDWEKHKGFCHEIKSRRALPTPIPYELGPEERIVPVL